MMLNPLMAPDLREVSESFRWNAEHVLGDSSPLYQKLAYRIAGDEALLALAAHAQPHQLPVNLLFGAVHYLLLRGADDPLVNFYPDFARELDTHNDPFPFFRAFCLAHAEELAALIATRRVQTNEVARCALFLPAFEWVARQLAYNAFALLEVGASAGLNLNWDKYAYAYADALCGEPTALVRLTCELRGALHPPLPQRFPQVYARAGLDLNPNDVLDADAMLWLRALVWPEQRERAERLERAIQVARAFPPRVIAGDALTRVPPLVQEFAPTVPVVLFHSFVLNQVDASARARYYAQLEALDKSRVWFDLAIEPEEWPARLVVTTMRGGARVQETLAICDHHGRWLEWIQHDASV